jgi:hypothetical protein
MIHIQQMEGDHMMKGQLQSAQPSMLCAIQRHMCLLIYGQIHAGSMRSKGQCYWKIR